MIIFNAKAYLNSRFKVKSTSRSVEFRVNCIYCDDTKFHMYVNIRKQLYNCYKCDSGGTLFQLIYDTDKCKSYGQAREVMQEFMGDVDKELGKVQYARSNLAAKIPEFISLATGENEQYYDYAVGWLAHRGIDLELAKYYGMGYCLVGRYENRIVVPIYSEGRLRSFVARAWSDGIEPKTFNPMINEADSPSNFLFGIDECPVGGIVYIVEGVFDAIRLRPHGLALCGKTLGPKQMVLLKRLQPSKIYIALDPDALDTAWKIHGKLAYAYDTSVLELPHDPDECTDEEVLYGISMSKTDGFVDKVKLLLKGKKV